jgi:chorismate-pyruvate lyase
MSVSDLQLQLNTLREQLEQNPQLTLEERGNLTEVMEQIQAQIEVETVSQDPSIADGVNLAVERFEVDHPTIAGTLRNVLVTLGSMGI